MTLVTTYTRENTYTDTNAEVLSQLASFANEKAIPGIAILIRTLHMDNFP